MFSIISHLKQLPYGLYLEKKSPKAKGGLISRQFFALNQISKQRCQITPVDYPPRRNSQESDLAPFFFEI